MENLNKLSFKTHKINEQALFIPMEDIKQEFDIKENINIKARQVTSFAIFLVL